MIVVMGLALVLGAFITLFAIWFFVWSYMMSAKSALVVDEPTPEPPLL